MKKVTLAFPDYESMWIFTNQTKAINVRIQPKENRLSGLFSGEEIDRAVKEFRAIQPINTSAGINTSQSSNAKTRTDGPLLKLRSRLHQLLSMANL